VTTVQFVRPAHRLIALHGEQVVAIKALGLSAGRETFGHRFHAPQPIFIRSAQSYPKQLEQGHVIASFEERRARMLAMIEAHAARLKAEPGDARRADRRGRGAGRVAGRVRVRLRRGVSPGAARVPDPDDAAEIRSTSL